MFTVKKLIYLCPAFWFSHSHLNFSLLDRYKLHVRVVPNSDIFEVGMITSDDKNFCFVQSKGKRRIISEEINDLKRTKISTDTCVTKAKKNDSISNEGSLVEDPNGPIRQYYHSSTMEPLEEGDWSIDSDDDEKTDEWRIKLSEQVRMVNQGIVH